MRGRPRGCRSPPRPGRRSASRRISPRGRSCQSRLTAQRIVPVAASTMPGVPTPIPRRVARESPDSSSISSWTTSSACSPSRPTTRRSIVRWTWPRRSTSAADEDVLAEVEADDVAGAVDELEEDRRLAAGRRSPPDLARHAVAHQSLITSPTVVRVRPLSRATSARLIGPRSYSARSTSAALYARVCWWVALVGNANARFVGPLPSLPQLPPARRLVPDRLLPGSVPPSSGRQRRPRPNFAQRLDKLYAALSSVWTNCSCYHCPCARRRRGPATLAPACRAPDRRSRLRLHTHSAHSRSTCRSARQRRSANRTLTRRRGSCRTARLRRRGRGIDLRRLSIGASRCRDARWVPGR